MQQGDKLVKNPLLMQQQETPKNGGIVAPLGHFNVQTNRITSRVESYLKIKGAFKVKVQNKGDVDVTIFGNYPLPSYSEETFETGDTNLGFSSDTAIEYPEESPTEEVNILLTAYYKVR